MSQDISKFRGLVNSFLRTRKNVEHSIGLYGEFTRTITRADGTVEIARGHNTLTSSGLNELAKRGITNNGSAFTYLAIGTQTAASSLGSVGAGMGEVSRKVAAIAASSNEYMVAVMTWAGAADSITSVDLRTASLVNHANSGSGIHLNFINSLATILADSDFLSLQMNIRVGSHAL